MESLEEMGGGGERRKMIRRSRADDTSVELESQRDTATATILADCFLKNKNGSRRTAPVILQSSLHDLSVT